MAAAVITLISAGRPVVAPAFTLVITSLPVTAGCFLLKCNHHMAERLLALASGGNVLVILQGRMNDPSLLRIHGFQ